MDSEDKGTPWESYEDMGKYDSLFPLLPDFVAQFTVGGGQLPTVGIPDKDSLRLARDIKTALIANAFDIGLAYAQKRYAVDANKTRWMGLTDRIDQLFREGREGFSWYISFGMDAIKNDSLCELSIHFFYRNMASLDASKRLSELGYLCETATILRGALEQFALCALLWSAPNGTDIRKLSRKENFAILKRFVPAAGELYGVLSRYAHFEYEHHTHFFAVSPVQNLTLQKAPVLRAYATHLLFLTMSCVAIYVLKAAPSQLTAVPASILKLRDFVDRVDRYSDDVCKILTLDSVLANFDILLQKLRRSL